LSRHIRAKIEGLAWMYGIP